MSEERHEGAGASLGGLGGGGGGGEGGGGYKEGWAALSYCGAIPESAIWRT